MIYVKPFAFVFRMSNFFANSTVPALQFKNVFKLIFSQLVFCQNPPSILCGSPDRIASVSLFIPTLAKLSLLFSKFWVLPTTTLVFPMIVAPDF